VSRRRSGLYVQRTHERNVGLWRHRARWLWSNRHHALADV